MALGAPVLVAAIGAAIAYALFQIFQKSSAQSKFAQANGCVEASRDFYQKDPLGFSLVHRMATAKSQKKLLEAIQERYEKNGNTFWCRILSNRALLTVEPANIQAILATKFNDFDIGPLRRDAFAPLLGFGTFTVDGADWKYIRGLIRPSFARNQIADLDMLEEHVQAFMKLVPKDGSFFDVQDLFFRLTLDSATHFLFGESQDSLNPNPSAQSQAFGDNLATAQEKLFIKSRLGLLGRIIPDPALTRACAGVHATVDKYVERAIMRYDAFQRGDEKDPMAKERYVFLDELVRSTQDKKILRDQLTNVLLAGRDTTASLLSSTFFYLARNPTVWKKLVAEVEELGSTPLSFEVLKAQKYLRFILNEILRLHPPVPINGRQANKDTYLPVGGGPDKTAPVFVPAGQFVSYNPYTLHRRKDLWGEDANEFRPERWEKHLPGWDYIPFNAGPRICLGQQYALTEASFTIVRLLQQFKHIEAPNQDPWQEGLQFTVQVGNDEGVKISLKP